MGLKNITTPIWSYSGPTTLWQPPEKTENTQDTLTFTAYVWAQYASITDNTVTVTARPYNTSSGKYPLNIIGDATATAYVIADMIVSLGAFWTRKIVWSDLEVDTGYQLMFLARTGFLNLLYKTVPENRAFHLDTTTSWNDLGSGVYSSGNIRIRAVRGTASVAGTRVTVTKDGDNIIQVLIYNRSWFDDKALNQLGATTTEYADEIYQGSSYYLEEHVRYIDVDTNLDLYLVINPVTTQAQGLCIRKSTGNGYALGIADGTPTWKTLVVYRYGAKSLDESQVMAHRITILLDPFKSPALNSPAFQYYIFTPLGNTWTILGIGRITGPMQFKYYSVATSLLLIYASQTKTDCRESTSTLRDMTTDRICWALSPTELLEGKKIYHEKNINHTGWEANGIDGGWNLRLLPLSSNGHAKYRNNSGVWVLVSNVSGGYTYVLGNGIYGIGPNNNIRCYTQKRRWTGHFEEKNDRVAYYGSASRIDPAFMKQISFTDHTYAGDEEHLNAIIIEEPSGSTPSDSEAETRYTLYTFPGGNTYKDGLIDLNYPAYSNANWDLGYDASENPQVLTTLYTQSLTEACAYNDVMTKNIGIFKLVALNIFPSFFKKFILVFTENLISMEEELLLLYELRFILEYYLRARKQRL